MATDRYTDEERRLLDWIGLGEDEFVRFRGIRIDGDLVRLETRLGAGNSECQAWPGQTCDEAGCLHPIIESLRARQNHIRDEEDWGDRTYLYFWFAPR